jgi:hydrogenase expression/formation protein HypD
MEVCGTHTMAISRYGIREILPENVELISGPGCPVCVTDAGYIDAAIELASGKATVMTFGDMIHVPGSSSTLSQCRAAGGAVVACSSPAEALRLARSQPGKPIVFLAVGFETTTAPLAGLLDGVIREGVRNLSLLTAFKRVPPALRILLADPETGVDGFLCPAHVSAIIGANAYRPFSGPGGVPCVIAGFEPLDILLGLLGIVDQVNRGVAEVDNQYRRVVRPEGNVKALALMDRYLRSIDARWRGLGTLPGSGEALRPEFSFYDAEIRYGLTVQAGRENPACRCGDVLKGKCRPTACPLFGRVCVPDHPVGPCMVSSEGTCSAYYRYERAG